MVSPEGTVTDYDQYQFSGGPSFTSSGLVLNLKRDNRKNSNNPQGGYYTSLSFRLYRPFSGSTYSWDAVYFDVRKYFPIQTRRKSILAARALYWQSSGEVPYLELPATFNDRESRVGRGYPYSRFRGKTMLYSEAEYRFPVSRDGFWGLVLFVNAQSLREPDTGNFERINPAAGFGLRIKFNKRSNVNLTIDFAFGKDSFKWNMNIGEFF
jgi:outer membrane protein assembly factor BamA